MEHSNRLCLVWAIIFLTGESRLKYGTKGGMGQWNTTGLL